MASETASHGTRASLQETAQAGYSRIGVSATDTDEEALRKAEVLLVSRAATYERMGLAMWESAWQVVVAGKDMPAVGDIGHVEPAFAAYVASMPRDARRCLVPGCGKGYAVECLAHAGHHTVGLEISASAARLARSHLRAALPRVALGRTEIHEGDFFGYAPPAPFDLIYDGDFLCSLPPDRRTAWAAAMRRLLAADGVLVMDLFPVGEFAGGPPFAMILELVRSLLEPHGFRAASAAEVAPAQRARPLFRGASEWLVLWVLDDPQEEVVMW